ncbi:hypothetical protein PDK16_18490 [Bacillus cereus]|nr:hypothetical protein [Bacillus cereus]
MNLSNRWIVIFLILPHLSNYYFRPGLLYPLILAWQSAVVLIALFVIYKRLTIINILLIFYMAIIMLSAFLNETLTGGIFYTVTVFTSFCIYISYTLKNFRELIIGLYYLFGILVVTNFLTFLIGGLDIGTDGLPIYLLGGKNAIALTTLPTISIAYLYSYTIHKKIEKIPLLLILICVISLYISDSGTGIMVSFLTILFIFLPKKVFPTFKTYLYIYIVVFFSIVIFRLQEVLFGDFIINVLHKDMTFTGRTYIWDVVLNAMKESWILGFGRGNDIISHYFFNLNETHNGVLEIMMYSGLLGVMFFLIILFAVGNKLSIYKNHIISKTLSFSIFAYMILGLTESVFYKKEFWILLIISYSVGNIIKSTDKDMLSKVNQAAD